MSIELPTIIQRISSQGINLIPIIPQTKKPPLGFPLIDYYERKKSRLTLQELARYASKGLGFAAIAGFNFLVGIDTESKEDYLKLWDRKIAESLPSLTVVVKTSRGYCAWFFDPKADFANLKSAIPMQPAIAGEIIVHDHLMNCPGNVHPSGAVYQVIGTDKIAVKPGIIGEVMERVKSLGWVGNPYYNASSPNGIFEGELTERLSEAEKERIVNQLLPCWKVGYRNRLILAICGLLIKSRVAKEDAKELVTSIATLANDRAALSSALSKVEYQYRNARNRPNLVGYSGIVAIMRELRLVNYTNVKQNS